MAVLTARGARRLRPGLLPLVVALATGPVAQGDAPLRLIVRTDRPEIAAEALGASHRRLLGPMPGGRSAAALPPAGWHLLDLPAGMSAAEAARAAEILVASGRAESAEVDRRVSCDAAPSDPFFASRGSWGQGFDDQWGLKAMRFPAAWDLGRGSPGITIAVVDTGADRTHPDLAPSLWVNPDEVPGNGVDDDGNGLVDDVNGWDFASGYGGRDDDPADGFGHGTLVAGIVGAATDNGRGTAGATWGCRVMVCKALDDTGYGYVSDIAAAMAYAVDEGASVIVLGLSGNGVSPALEAAVDAARQSGVVVVASAGNLGADVEDFFPANIDDVVTVGALGVLGSVPSWSNRGATIDLVAPAEAILGPRALGTDFRQSGEGVVDTDYYRASGTSFAAPLVAGAAALLVSATPWLTVDQIVDVLRTSASDVEAPGVDGLAGWGSADAERALSLVRAMTSRIETPRHREVIAFGASLVVTGSAAGADLASWQLFAGAGIHPASFGPLTGPRTTPVSGGTLHAMPSGALADGVYTLLLRATSADGVVYEDRRVIEIDNSRGNLSGSVAWQGDGTPAVGVTVWAMDPATQQFVAPATMSSGGAFSFDGGLPAGDYVLMADGSYSEYDTEFWHDATTFGTATLVGVTPMGSVTGIDFRLARRARVLGTVRDEGGSPLQGMVVELLYGGTFGVARATSSAGNGSFAFADLPNGNFVVRARGGDRSYAAEYWQEVTVETQATVLALQADLTITGIDFTLRVESGRIAGVVQDAGGSPLSGFPVELLCQSQPFSRATATDAAGAYALDRLPAGDYLVRTGPELEYELQYFDGAPDEASARTIHLLDGGAFLGADLSLETTWFADVTAQVGPLVGPESGDAWGVVPAFLDGDDRPDLYLVNQVGPNGYMVQDAAGAFHDEAAARNASSSDLKLHALVFDRDNDGDQDLYVPRFGRFGAPSLNVLLERRGAAYADATFTAGVVDVHESLDAAAGDVDGDGYLDLYVVNAYSENLLHRARGDGSYDDVSASSGAAATAGNNDQCATFADVDGDGDLDLLVTATEMPGNGGNLLFVNAGDGTFTEEAAARGVQAPSYGFAATFGDVDDDGDLDLFAGSSDGGILYENDGQGRFTDVTAAWGLAGVDESSGASFGDVDGDGLLDLAVADYQGGIRLMMGAGPGFVDRSHLSGVVRSGQSKHLALVDLDVDGRLDIVLSHDWTGTRVYRNRIPPRRWLELRLHGRRSNRDGVGAVVRLQAAGRTQTRVAGSGDAGNKLLPLVHFGLGSTNIADVQIRWPSGIVQTLAGIAADQRLDVHEPAGTAAVVTAGPGAANGPIVHLVGADGLRLPISFAAFASTGYSAHARGAELGATGSPGEEIVTMAGEGPTLAPHVRGFAESGAPLSRPGFFAYGSLRFGGNVAVARGLDPAADVIVTGPGPGASLVPHVRGWDAAGNPLPGFSFVAFPGLVQGARPAAADVAADDRDDVLVAPGPGPLYGASLRAFAWSGGSVTPLPQASFFPFAGATAGARPAGGGPTLVAAPGPSSSQPSRVRGFDLGSGTVSALPGFDLVAFPGAGYGAIPAQGDLEPGGSDETLVVPGPGPAYPARVRAIRYDGSAATLMGKPDALAFDPPQGYGGSVGAIFLGP